MGQQTVENKLKVLGIHRALCLCHGIWTSKKNSFRPRVSNVTFLTTRDFVVSYVSRHFWPWRMTFLVTASDIFLASPVLDELNTSHTQCSSHVIDCHESLIHHIQYPCTIWHTWHACFIWNKYIWAHQAPSRPYILIAEYKSHIFWILTCYSPATIVTICIWVN